MAQIVLAHPLARRDGATPRPFIDPLQIAEKRIAGRRRARQWLRPLGWIAISCAACGAFLTAVTEITAAIFHLG